MSTASGAEPSHPANRLAQETSPYLLQHAHNPVDWYPWGAEALARSKTERKPIFLSVGYSACHWCHVMERESFESEALAKILNEHFVAIKVDREERPDVDEIYMTAVQAMTGSGGWPMSVFLTPDLEPFYGGTYFPPVPRHGMPAFSQVLNAIAERWKTNPEALTEQGGKLAQHLREQAQADVGAELDAGFLDKSLAELKGRFDSEWGGFGEAPKFPHAMDIQLCLRHWRRTGDEAALHMATISLRKMANGGLFDQLGGGFHRYSVDEKWLIPHFEKMLYDNGLLIPAYIEAYQATSDEFFADIARRACEWMLREMVTEGGGIASAQDADSEGEEGAYFVWTPDELEEVLGADSARRAAEWFDVTEHGNFEHGKSALWRPESETAVAEALRVDVDALRAEMAAAAEKLLAARDSREKPMTDDKVLASWNGLAIGALCSAGRALGESRFVKAAHAATQFLHSTMRRDDGRLFATARHGRAHLDGTLDDHVFVVHGLIELYQCEFDERWLAWAVELTELIEKHFADGERGGYYATADDAEELLIRPRTLHDGALPAGNAVHVANLLKLEALTGKAELGERAARVVRSLGGLANRHPAAFSQLGIAVDLMRGGLREVVLGGPPVATLLEPFRQELRSRFLPDVVTALANEHVNTELVAVAEGRTSSGDEVRAFVCTRGTCKLPATTPSELSSQLEAR